jgi:hypothetical protein
MFLPGQTGNFVGYFKTNTMNIPTQELIADLVQRAQHVTETVRLYRSLDPGQLNFKPQPDSWSILECLEHLNLYGDFYLPEIERQILRARAVPASDFKPGVIGNYFAQLMLPKPDGQLKKMKAPKNKLPAASQLSAATIERFLKQQDHLLQLLNIAQKVDLTKTKTAISLSKLIRLRLGDTLRFYVYHIERHVAQAERLH